MPPWNECAPRTCDTLALRPMRALASVGGESAAHHEAVAAVSGRVSVQRHQRHGASAESLAALIQVRGETDIAGLILSDARWFPARSAIGWRRRLP